MENRIKAFAIDYLIMCIIGYLTFKITDNIFLGIMIIYPITMNKDFLNGKSIGKRLFNIQVQNLTDQKASEWKCSLRNFLFIIPFDLIFTIFSPTRRIGDRIAGTKIGINKDCTLKTIRNELKNYRINKKLIFGLLFALANTYALIWLYEIILS
ncbi:RDD family protein [Mangrovimonas sp. YM274]|uniref:RDD family protein n=1 Tax=Mangrovimonas sp. YM274 TaxID=3070660 RepID=UPI0035A64098